MQETSTTMRHRQANDREGSQDLADRFHELADRWEHETWMLSSSAQMAAHPDCKAIVSLGMPAVPLILKRMQTQGGHWYRVLRDITKVNPVAPAERGNVAAMQRAWLRWGRDHGSIQASAPRWRSRSRQCRVQQTEDTSEGVL